MEGAFFERSEGAACAPLRPGYAPRRPEQTLLHRVVRENLETLLAEASADGEGLPGFVEREFRKYVGCGALARGFARVACNRCGKEELVAFSCKCRGWCPPCVARRMDDTAAHLVDRVLPFAPYRQWVLSLPFRRRLELARDHELLGALRRIFVAAVRRWQRRKARELGHGEVETAAVCFTQRHDSLLRVNPHLHSLHPDAVFVERAEGGSELVVLPKPSQEDVEAILERVVRRARKVLERAEEESGAQDALDRLRARQLMLFAPPKELPEGKLSARREGFSLHAATHLHANDRDGLERMCRYALRPPVANSRLSQRDDGKLVLKLKRALPDGREVLELSPLDLMRRLAGLVPRPRVHQTHYFGAFASHSGMRERVVPRRPRHTSWCTCEEEAPSSSEQRELPLRPRPLLAVMPLVGEAAELVKAPAPRPRVLPWDRLLARTFGDPVLTCRCGGRRRIVAFVEDPAKAVEVLAGLGVRAEEPGLARARSPPQGEMFEPSPEYAANAIHPDD